jgi:alpha-L-arabinofuranosidase
MPKKRITLIATVSASTLLAIVSLTTGVAAKVSAQRASRPDFGTSVQADPVTGPQFNPAYSYEIVNPASGNALSAAGTGIGSDPQMTIEANTNAEDQLWHFSYIGGGYYQVVNDHTGTVLSTVNGQWTPGAQVHLWTFWQAFPDQKWAVKPQGDGTDQIINSGKGNLLSTTGGATTSGTTVELWGQVPGQSGQSWKIVPVTPTIQVDASSTTGPIPQADTAMGMEDVNHEIYGGLYSQMIFGEAFQEPADSNGVSDMWKPVTSGTAAGSFSTQVASPFKGDQSQEITFSGTGGKGSAGVENRGLSREGMSVVNGKPYDGMVTLRGTPGEKVELAFENANGMPYGTTTVGISGTGWQTYHFNLTPDTTDTHAQFAISLVAPGTVDVGYAFLEPGTWGRYENLPVRKDVAETLKSEGVQALRLGGSAVDATSWNWQDMTGPVQDRPVTQGTWYPYESNGWGIFDFYNMCQALGIQECIAGLNIWNQTPQSIADFINYLRGPVSNPWGAKRAADGHPQPYTINTIELGNEETVNATYAQQFESLAAVIWKMDPQMRIIVGDFCYNNVITDPNHVTGACSGITNLNAQQQILAFAKQNNAEVEFDVHVWTGADHGSGSATQRGTPDAQQALAAFDSYVDSLTKLSDGANFKVVVLELNADIHSLQRALNNAYAINHLADEGSHVAVVSSANAFQVDGQNGNGWNQGLVFMNQSTVWTQPPYAVEQMNAQSYQPDAVQSAISGGSSYTTSLTAAAAANGSAFTLRLVNTLPVPRQYKITLQGLHQPATHITVTTLQPPDDAALTNNLQQGATDATNTFADPMTIVPQTSTTGVSAPGNSFTFTFPAYSYTTLQLR